MRTLGAMGEEVSTRLSLDELQQRYAEHLFAAAFSVLGNVADAEDVVQDTLLKYYLCKHEFENEAHVRAWCLRVAVNGAKDAALAFWRRNREPLDDYVATLPFERPADRDLFGAAMRLPERYRIALHLHYFEGLSVNEAAATLAVRPGTVKSRLSRGRRMLKDMLDEEDML